MRKLFFIIRILCMVQFGLIGVVQAAADSENQRSAIACSHDCIRAYKQKEYDRAMRLVKQYPEACLSVRSPTTHASLLHCAAGHVRVEDVEIFLERYSVDDPAWFDGKKNTPLHYACLGYLRLKKEGSTYNLDDRFEAVVRKIVARKPSCINEANAEGVTPLHVLAASDVRRSAFKVFKSLGASFEMQDIQGQTPVHYACKNSKQGLIRFLMSEEEKVIHKKNTPDSPHSPHYVSRVPVKRKQSLHVVHKKRGIIVDFKIKDCHGKRAIDYIHFPCDGFLIEVYLWLDDRS